MKILEISNPQISRRDLLLKAALAPFAVAASTLLAQPEAGAYQPLEIRKQLRIAVVGGGFGAHFPWNHDPNCSVTAVAELRDDRRKILRDTFRCDNTYGEFHRMLKDPKVDAIAFFVGAPSHVPYCADAMHAGKHVICSVPAAMSLEECQRLVDTVKRTGQTYMMAETSCFHAATMAARALRRQGKLGTIYYSEGAYLHDHGTLLESGRVPPALMEMFVYQGKPTWRMGMVPGYYTTHAMGPVIAVTGEKLVEVTGIGVRIDHPFYKKNQYNNPFICETHFLKTSGGHAARISTHWWTTSPYREGADYYGTKGSFLEPWMGRPALVSYQQTKGAAEPCPIPDYSQALPPSLRPFTSGGHGGAEAFIVREFVTACLENRRPIVDVYNAVAFTAPGICGHDSAMHDGESRKVPDFGAIG